MAMLYTICKVYSIFIVYKTETDYSLRIDSIATRSNQLEVCELWTRLFTSFGDFFDRFPMQTNISKKVQNVGKTVFKEDSKMSECPIKG